MRGVTGLETVLNVANYASGDSDTASLRTPRIALARSLRSAFSF